MGHKWKSKFGGTEVSEAKRLRELEAENRKLKHLLADSMLDVVTPQAKRLVVSSLMSSQDLSQRRACQLANLHRSTYHYQTKQPARDVALRVRMKQLATLHSAYGYLILHALLKQEGLVVNKKRTYRVYTEEGLQVRTKRRKKLYRPRVCLELPDTSNERWSMDFVHDQLSNGRRFRVLNVVDDYSRECILQLADTSISGIRVARSLTELIQRRGKPNSIICDNGTEFTSKAMFFWARDNHIKLNFIQPGKPTQNAFVESFNGKFRNECLNQHWFLSLHEARQEIRKWQHHYNTVRPHSSLNYLPPSQYAEKVA